MGLQSSTLLNSSRIAVHQGVHRFLGFDGALSFAFCHETLPCLWGEPSISCFGVTPFSSLLCCCFLFVAPLVSWAKIAEVMPGRTAKQCRERYNNHVDPAIKKDKIWSAEEDALVMQLHAEHHNQFAKIARSIEGRCYDDVKNRRVPLHT